MIENHSSRVTRDLARAPGSYPLGSKQKPYATNWMRALILNP